MKSRKRKNSTSEKKPSEICIFWSYFSEHSNDIAEQLNAGNVNSLTNSITQKLNILSKEVGWEIGPGKNKLYSFSITLKGNIKNIHVAHEILSHAPSLPDWEFNLGRPSKVWDGTMRLKNSSSQSVVLNASSWRYVLTGFDSNKFFDISIIAKWPKMDLKSKIQAAVIAIQNNLGEITTLERFDRIEIADIVTDDVIKRTSNFMDLKQHIDYLDNNKDSQ